MRASRGRGLVVAVAACLVMPLASQCTTAGSAHQTTGGTTKGDFSIGVLLPDTDTPRWRTADRPLITKRIKELCGNCTVRYANASGNVATQQAQVDSMIANGARALILCPVESRALSPSVTSAHDSHVPVVAYDRLADGPLSAYSGYDSEQIGRLQAQGLLAALGPGARHDQVVMMNGEPTDPNARALKKGALSVLRGRVRIGATYNTTGWIPQNAFTNTLAAIAKLGPDAIDGFYSANDGLAAGILTALKADGVTPLPPITGQDADLAAVRRVIAGEQTMTVYKSFSAEADAAAEMAVALARGTSIGAIAKQRISSNTNKDIPAYLGTLVSVNRANVKHTIVDRGVYTVQQLCTPKLMTSCREAGLTG
ncbi:sugar ABC transporter substrate-binding protein [Actinacidiphila paucisporea]|uniref:D-xylose transport system substrate-binding protein n=1 Tax=Actinacidiphila paucisporea TaxID=310782 RepID=A0A1M7Q988_9ACTN|nr:substrate-binding domain-containing protein [Actinacidiphila paucisporea]SHN27217.1 D-xylose transport system substrate-binding protein [Actinacidiphila paucisporea]